MLNSRVAGADIKSKSPQAPLFFECLENWRRYAGYKSLTEIRGPVRIFTAFSSWCISCSILDPAQVSKILFFTWLDSLKLGHNTKIKLIKVIRRILRLAFEEGIISKPALYNVPVPKLERRSRKILTEEEMNRIWTLLYGPRKRKLSVKIKRWRVIYNLALLGLRLNEILQLRFSQVGGDSFTTRVKMGKIRTFPIDTYLREALLDWTLVCENEDRLFNVDKSTLSISFQNLLKASGIMRESYCSLHLMRHTVATRLFAATRDMRRVQRYMGHASIETTELYIHEDEIEQKESLEIIRGVGKGGDKDGL